MKNRIFIMLNAVGCVVLTGLVAFQWMRERASHVVTEKLKIELSEVRLKHAEELRKTSAMERDIATLKEAIAATQEAAEVAAREMATQSVQVEELHGELGKAREQEKAWQAALAERDAKLKEMSGELAATRRRLDEVIVKLKAAAER